MNESLSDLESASTLIGTKIKKPLKDLGLLISASFVFGFIFLFLQSWQLWVATAFITAAIASSIIFLKSFPGKTINFKTRKGLIGLILLIPVTPLYLAPIGISWGLYQLLLVMLNGSFAFTEMLAVISGFIGSALWTYLILSIVAQDKENPSKIQTRAKKSN